MGFFCVQLNVVEASVNNRFTGGIEEENIGLFFPHDFFEVTNEFCSSRRNEFPVGQLNE